MPNSEPLDDYLDALDRAYLEAFEDGVERAHIVTEVTLKCQNCEYYRIVTMMSGICNNGTPVVVRASNCCAGFSESIPY